MMIALLAAFEEHEVDEKRGSEKRRFHFNVHIHWERDAEVVGVGHCLLEEAAPLLANAADLHTFPTTTATASRR